MKASRLVEINKNFAVNPDHVTYLSLSEANKRVYLNVVGRHEALYWDFTNPADAREFYENLVRQIN